ncbi:Uncharacterised protein r2_g477 [Pycnogonum litorale]
MKVLACIVLLAVAVYASPQYGQQQSGYGQQQSGYGQQNGQINYKLKYDIELPKDNHDSHAQWQFEDDAKNTHYNLQQYHPYGAKSNVYYSQQSDH